MDVIISLGGQDEQLAVLGSRDHHLRQVRDALGVKIQVGRGGDLKLEGEDDRVHRAVQVFESLRGIYKKQRIVTSEDVAEILDIARYVEDPVHVSLGMGTSQLEASGREIRLGARAVRPRTEGQQRYVRALSENEMVFCIGPAGTGKTYLAVAKAVSLLRQGRIKKLVLVRPAVEAGEHLGFLPGDLESKINPYLRPLLDALHDLMEYGQIRRYMGNDIIEIAPLAYMRGRTMNDAVIILDEGQNTTIPQMKMFLTRMGNNSRIVVTGDVTQVDLPPSTPSGLADAVARLSNVPGIGVTWLDRADIVRHPLVQAIVDAYETPAPPIMNNAPGAGVGPVRSSAPTRDGLAPAIDSATGAGTALPKSPDLGWTPTP